ncbi:MAG: PAS domain-containing protein [Spirochaetaceae bacterium]|nr:PAS domain-containing protein [Spirochaetaceae bacterium]MDT8299020.1 PAS domain-containing protein [Spirochaetaceae bacterium]
MKRFLLMLVAEGVDPRVFLWALLGFTLAAAGWVMTLRRALRKKSREMRMEKEQYSALFTDFLDPILIGDADTGILTDCNRAAGDYFGRSRGDLIGSDRIASKSSAS